jgi:hypothetical protein
MYSATRRGNILLGGCSAVSCPSLFVPVHPNQHGMLTLRTGRLPAGQRTGLAFSSKASLVAALGPEQPWTRLSEQALHAMLTPLGIEQLRLDPRPVREVAPSAPPARIPAARRHPATRRKRDARRPVHRSSAGGERSLTA